MDNIPTNNEPSGNGQIDDQPDNLSSRLKKRLGAALSQLNEKRGRVLYPLSSSTNIQNQQIQTPQHNSPQYLSPRLELPPSVRASHPVPVLNLRKKTIPTPNISSPQLSKNILTNNTTSLDDQIPEATFPEDPQVFPLAPFVSEYTEKRLFDVATGLDFLFYGSSHAENFTRNLSTYPPTKALDHLRDTIKLTQGSTFSEPNFAGPNNSLQQCDENEVMTDLLEEDDNSIFDALQKGDYVRINADKIDLPKPTKSRFNPSNWLRILPRGPAREFFNPKNKKHILAPLIDALDSSNKFECCESKEEHQKYFRRSNACLPGHYPRLLQRLTELDLVSWSLECEEDVRYSQIANKITMSLFANVKDKRSDRLVTWPRLHNHMMPDAPKTQLPNPEAFGHIQTSSDLNLSAFCFDISTMSFQILLPNHLVRYFPLPMVRFGDLPNNLRNKLEYKFRRRIYFDEYLRPCQNTMPIGFKWAVFVIHSISQHLIKQSWDIFKRSRLAIDSFQIYSLAETTYPIKLKAYDVVLCHIIDDVNVVMVNWPKKSADELNRILQNEFVNHHLFINESKSTKIGEVLYTDVTFCGWTWYLKKQMVIPRLKKMEQTRLFIQRLLEKETWDPKLIEKACSKSVCCGLGRRYLLASLSAVFHHSDKLNKLVCSPPSEKVREEFVQYLSLLPLASMNLNRETWRTVVSIFSCERYVRVVYTTASESTVDRMIQVACGDVKTVLEMDDEISGSELEISGFIKRHRWTVGFINVWEGSIVESVRAMRAAELALGWTCNQDIAGKRLLFLYDSASAVNCIRKGRASNSDVNKHCRRFGSLVLATDVVPYFCLISEGINPGRKPIAANEALT